ncbi:uncharacterized protein LOC133904117 [Phragmites australis]|uniref:uncharacterized protein LOC133904117 n=1 Tax=Phragmites australis TaxID=29695 RepID=UPI002D788B56|nr:uncharacterized protein LOC133904117 [Phragmites australis]
MRIRKSASRLLGSAYSAAAPAAPAPDASPPLELPPPPPHLAPCSAPEYCGGGGLASPATASGEHCELSRSPWDLIPELSISDPQVEDDLVGKYFVHVACRASWLFTTSMPTASVKKKEKPAVASAGEDNREVVKKVMKKLTTCKEKKKKEKESEVKKNAKVKKEEGEEKKKEESEDGGAQVWKCKKNDGKRWHCHRTVSQPNSLCDYHFVQKRSYLNPEFEFASAVASEAAPVSAAASKPSSTSKPRKKKSGGDFVATEGFYYYTGFGPSRTKRHCRSSGMNEPVSAKQELEHPEYASPTNQAQADDDTNRAADHDDVSMCDEDIAGIAGGDEESSDDDGIGTSVRTINGNGEPRASNDDSKRKTPWKRWRKPMKARSLKSLM